MSTTKSIFTATAIASLAAILGSTSSMATGAAAGLPMKPLHGVSFDVGTQRAVGYFTSENGQCKLAVTLADGPRWDDEVPAFMATRFEAAVPAGKTTLLRPVDGSLIEFRCQPGAQTMSVHGVKQLAAGDLR